MLHEPARFAMTLFRGMGLGATTVGLGGYADEVRLETGELETGYEINVPLSENACRAWTGKAEVCATPATATIYRPDGRTRLQGWAGGGRLFGLKIERSVLEAQLAELAGLTVRSVVPLTPGLDLRTGLGRRWWDSAVRSCRWPMTRQAPWPRPMIRAQATRRERDQRPAARSGSSLP